MQISFVGKNIELTPALKNHITEKLQPVTTRYNHIESVNVVLHIEHVTHIAEATLEYNGDTIHASAKSDDMYHSIDTLIAKILGQVTRHKEKSLEVYS